MPLSTAEACVSPQEVEHLVRSRRDGTMPPSQQALYDALSGSMFWQYVRKYPERREVIGAVIEGVAPTTAAQGICDARLARKWAEHYFAVACLRLDQMVRNNRPSDRDILMSICSLTHGRVERGGSGGRPRVGATMCLGCTAGAA